jgi:hypothetical protein
MRGKWEVFVNRRNGGREVLLTGGREEGRLFWVRPFEAALFSKSLPLEVTPFGSYSQ